MQEEVVRRRGWMSESEFLDLVGAVNLLPGPNSTELAIEIGRRRTGAWGLVGAAGGILPWLQRSPPARAFLDGVNVGALALMALVTWQLGRTSIDGPGTAAFGLAALALLWVRVNSAWLIAASALGGLLFF
jgi:chromate transporter